MAKNIGKNKNNKKVCSAEQAINDANWDKFSPWSVLVDKCKTAVWKEYETLVDNGYDVTRFN